MMPRTPDQRRWWVAGCWLGAMALLLLVSLPRLNFSYDLGLFLPAPQSLDQQILVARVGDAPGSRYLLMAVPDQPEKSEQLVSALSGLDGIGRVLDGAAGSAASSIPEPLMSHRWLLTDMDWSAAGLHRTLQQRLAELGLGADADYRQWLRRDPALSALDSLTALQGHGGADWRTASGQQIVVAETTAPAFDINAQQAVVSQVREQLRQHYGRDTPTLLSGAGVFGVDLRDTIQQEATWRSLWASLALLTVLLLAYRQGKVLLLSALPLASALVAGLAGVGLAFDAVHGITLAFGFTLLGVAIDYPLHYFSHARRQAPTKALHAVWPTLRLSAISTMLVYLALLTGGAEGMAQLGLFSALGVAAALATTRWVVPSLDLPATSLPADPTEKPASARVHRGVHPRAFAGLVVVMLVSVYLATLAPTIAWWNDDLNALSPVQPERLSQDGQLRQAIGAPSMRYQIALQDPDLQSLLRRSEQLQDALQVAVEQGWLEGFGGIGQLLPSATTQRLRQQRIPDRATLQQALEQATASLPFRPSAFEPFIEDAMATREMALLIADDYHGTPLAGALSAFLLPPETLAGNAGWTSLITLHGEVDVAVLEPFLQQQRVAGQLVDYRAASKSLVADYRQRTARVLASVLGVIVLILLWRVRPLRALWCVTVVVSALALAASLLRLGEGSLNLYHMAGLLLVAGIGLDYALFLSRPEDDARDSRHAVTSCAASTMAAFGVLAFSAIPALGALGAAVALGAAISLALAWLGAWQGPDSAGNDRQIISD